MKIIKSTLLLPLIVILSSCLDDEKNKQIHINKFSMSHFNYDTSLAVTFETESKVINQYEPSVLYWRINASDLYSITIYLSEDDDYNREKDLKIAEYTCDNPKSTSSSSACNLAKDEPGLGFVQCVFDGYDKFECFDFYDVTRVSIGSIINIIPVQRHFFLEACLLGESVCDIKHFDVIFE